MSLDMFLDKKTYVSGSDNKLKISGINSPLLIPRVKYISEQVAYWRKANAIHQWFVTNVQGGKDDNQQYDVSTEQLKELLALCKKVQKEPSMAPKLLPTQSGFLFGSTDYDSRYFQAIEYTIDAIETELNVPAGQWQEYIYQSDW